MRTRRPHAAAALPALALLVCAAAAQDPAPAQDGATAGRDWMVLPVSEAGPEIGIGYGIQFLDANLFGGREFLRLVLEGSTEHLEWYEADYSMPSIGGGPWSARTHFLRIRSPARRFYGLGGRTGRREETDHQLSSTTASGLVQRRAGPFQAWGGVRYREAAVGSGSAREIPDTIDRHREIDGIRGGDLLGVRAGGAWDGVRWHVNEGGYRVHPLEGVRAEAEIRHAGLDTGDFQESLLSGRVMAYLEFPWTEHVVSLRLAADTLRTRHPPFWNMPYLGSHDTLRGYVDGRFVGNDRILANAEYRFPIREREAARLVQAVRGAVFHDAGRVYARGEPRTLRHLAHSTGVGVRLVLRPGVVARLDHGISREDRVTWVVFSLPF